MEDETKNVEMCENLHRFKSMIMTLRGDDSKIKMKLDQCIPTKSFKDNVDIRQNCQTFYNELTSLFDTRNQLIDKCLKHTQEKYTNLQSKDISDPIVSKNLMYYKREVGVERIVQEQAMQQPNLMNGITTLLKCDHQEVLMSVLQSIKTLIHSPESTDVIKQNVSLKVQCFNLKEKVAKKPTNNQLYITCLEVVEMFSMTKKRESEQNNDAKADSKRFISNINRRAKQLLLQIEYDDEGEKTVINQILMKYKGIISFTWDKNNQRVILRVNPKFKLELLAYKLVTETHVKEVYKICRNITKQEVLVPIDIPRGEVVDLRETGYFPDNYDAGEGQADLDEDDENHDHSNPSLDEAKLPLSTGNDANGDGGNTWFSNVGTFLSRKLFW